MFQQSNQNSTPNQKCISLQSTAALSDTANPTENGPCPPGVLQPSKDPVLAGTSE